METLRQIEGVAVLEKSGQRLMAQYNDLGALATREAQLGFESAFTDFAKSQYTELRKGVRVAVLDERIIVFSIHPDLYIVIGAQKCESALRLEAFLNALTTAFTLLCGKEVSVASVQKNYCDLLILLEESIDRGMLLASTAEEMVSRVQMQEFAPSAKPSASRSAIRGLFNLIG